MNLYQNDTMLNLAFDSAVPSGNLSPEWVFTYGHTYIHNKINGLCWWAVQAGEEVKSTAL